MAQYYVYILANATNLVLYTGITSDLKGRVWQHKNNFYPDSFTSKYRVYKLVYYENGESAESAIAQEKQIKGGSRKKKIDLINMMNSDWEDLSDEL